MALLVPDSGELQSLRYLVNSNHQIPRNLILKLFSSNTTPAEGDVPSQSAYYEPYDASGLVGYGTAPNNGYPLCVNNRWDQDYTDQYGILLNGNLLNVRTILSPIASTTGSGATGEYTITVSSTLNIAVGHYVTGGNVGSNAVVAAIDGNTIVLTVPNTATFSSEALEFGVGTTTASYPEQTFTFTDAGNQQYGYYLARANNMPVEIHGVSDAVTVEINTGVLKSQTIGVIAQSYVTLFETKYEPGAVGNVDEFGFVVDNIVGINTNQRVIGDGIAPEARVVGFTTNIVYVNKANTGAVTGVTTFFKNVSEDITIGMGVTHSNLSGEINAIPENTRVIGIDEKSRIVYLNNSLVNNIQSATGATITFSSSKVSTGSTEHGLVPGDVIYIAAGTGNTTTTSSTYTIFETPDSSTFTTTPALDGDGAATLYSSIFFAERFTNGPYNIQNNGDQIKVTLNISLDWLKTKYSILWRVDFIPPIFFYFIFLKIWQHSM